MTKVKGKGFEMNWKGDQVVEEVEDKAILILADFGLAVEGKAKQELKPGHGVKTGTLRRSIHTANPEYNWAGDNIVPSKSAPNLGGKLVTAVRKGKQLVVAVGSGLIYAMTVHQGYGSFDGYHYLTNGLEKARSQQLNSIIQRHKV